MILQDMKELMHTPGITHIAFRESDLGFELLLGIEHIYINDPATRKVRDIGEFIIIINRKSKQVRFVNITGPLTRMVDGVPHLIYHHPHVNSHGEMCIVEGKEQLNEYLTEGQIAPVARMLIKALYTVDQMPFPDAKLSYWPTKGTRP